MDGITRPSWWNYPLACSKGHPWRPGTVIVRAEKCGCRSAEAEGSGGHLIVRCREPGCNAAWYRPAHEDAED